MSYGRIFHGTQPCGRSRSAQYPIKTRHNVNCLAYKENYLFDLIVNGATEWSTSPAHTDC